MPTPAIIGFVSKGGCGKDACSKYLTKKYGASEITMSGFIKEALDIFYIYPDREAISWFIRTVRKRFSKNILAHAAIAEIQKNTSSFYVLNGIRIKKEVELLRRRFGQKFILVDISCTDEIRFSRIKTRQQSTGIKKDNVNTTLAKFLKWEKEIGNEKEIPAIERKADHVIENNGTKKELFEKLDKLIATKIKK